MKRCTIFLLRKRVAALAPVAAAYLFGTHWQKRSRVQLGFLRGTRFERRKHCKPTTSMVVWTLAAGWGLIGTKAAGISQASYDFAAPPRAATSNTSAGSDKYSRGPIDDVQRLAAIEVDIREERYLTAETILREYLQRYPTSSRAHYDLGYVLFRMRGGRLPLADAIKESISELSRSLVLNLNNSDAHKILALDLVMIQREDLAEPEFKQAERLNPGSAELHYFLGRHYMERSDYISAKMELETAIQLDPTYMKAYENLGITMHMMGEGPAALTNYLKAVDLDERQDIPSEFPYLDLSKFYYDQNQFELAESFALKALRKNPHSDQAYFELARNYRERTEWNKAADALTKAIAINPRAAEYYFLLAQTYHRLGKLQESRDSIANYLKYRDLVTQSQVLPEPE
jgi:tetratricopeptide (TPR) repeat protein